MVLKHPTIHDGWFREISPQWPGQAMSLQVRQILHVEQSKFQDVLVFESETYGNVLVLDGAIQCTERDEFSYQEMITHLPLGSHPNPEKVLVIGGGDGGVVREALKHSTVQEVVLCDIDEAVIRVSKQYLPHMSKVFADPRVTVFVGDGFQFLKENKATYDVIITDSSDPVGPAHTLFEKPYFQLLHDALREGGAISTQGECLWLHLPLIKELNTFTKTIFPTVEYAFTTIPTYPSGQIGFVLCSKDAKRNMRHPVRDVPDCTYYNKDIHQAAFVLPEFGRVKLANDKDITPILGKQVPSGTKTKKILLLGSGYVAGPAADYILRNPANHLTIACRTLKAAEELAANHPRASGVALDVNETAALDLAIAEHDVVVSLIPYIYHATVIKSAIKGKTHVVTTSYVSPAMRELDAEAKKAGIVVMNEIGLDPGIDHLYAIKTIEEVHAKGGKIKEFLSYCGGLPSPSAANNPLGYKFSWSSRGVLLALLNDASFYAGGQIQRVSGKELMRHAAPYYISPAYAFVAYPNRDSTPFRKFYNIPEAETIIRGTLRYQGFPEFIGALVKLGWLDEGNKEWLTSEITWAQALQMSIGTSDATESSLVARVKGLITFPTEQEARRILSGLKWIGLFSDEIVVPKGSPINLLDTLCARLELLMKFEPGESDLVMLQHKFLVEWKDGRSDTITSTLEAYGSPLVGGYSAMAKLVGVPCGIAVQFVLDGIIKTPGVHAPYSEELCAPLRAALEAEGITMTERVL